MSIEIKRVTVQGGACCETENLKKKQIPQKGGRSGHRGAKKIQNSSLKMFRWEIAPLIFE
jgi:hypothetical protein